MGAQVCNSDGHSYGMCQCSVMQADSGSGDIDAAMDSTVADSSTTADSSTPADTGTIVDSSTIDSPAEGGACAGHITYAGKWTTQQGSLWTYNAMVGLAAGDAACQAVVGADHACTYDDIVAAAAHGELSAVTGTAWLQRGHAVTVTATSPTIVVLGLPASVGTTYQWSLGSNCANFDYATDHLNDGEFVDFSTGGNTPTFHFDDNPNIIQTTPKDIPCGHNTMPRDVLCCFAECGG
jgi:hypothetical protein